MKKRRVSVFGKRAVAVVATLTLLTSGVSPLAASASGDAANPDGSLSTPYNSPTTKEQAKQQLDAANEKLKTAQHNLDAAKMALDEASQNASQKADAYKSAQDAYNSADASAAKAFSDAKADAQAAEQQAKTDMQQKAADYSNAQNAEAAAKDDLAAAQAELVAANNEVDAAQAEVDALPAYADKGIYGFFMWLGDDAAANVLTSAEYASSTNLGAEGDASSLENVEKTFQLMRDGNAIRAELGLGELKVTSTLMAYAVSDCNWSYNKTQHAQQFNAGENLAWGYGTAAYDRNSSVYSNPFRGWYDEEKQAFDDAVASGNYPGLASMSAWEIYSKYPDLFQEVGHYLNVIDPDYTVTGFAYNNASGALYGCASGQVFDYSSNGDAVYTVNEYAAKFAEYKKIAGSDAKERLAAAKQKQSEVQACVSQAQSAVADAQSATQVAYNESIAAQSAYGREYPCIQRR